MHHVEAIVHAGREAWRLASPERLETVFVPGAGMLGASLRHRDEELLWLGDGVDAYVREARWCGIPLLHPWANRLRRDGFVVAGQDVRFGPEASPVARDANGLPIHGLVTGAADWRVGETGAADDRAWLTASLDFAADPARARAFPFPHRLEVRVELAGSTLRITTALHARGVAVPIAFGWHPYLTLPGVPRSDWHVTLPVRTHARLDARCLPTGEVESVHIPSAPLGARTYDDLFPELAPGEPFVLAGGGRRIETWFGPGYDVAVVYAPPSPDLLCFEPMTAPTDPFEGPTPANLLAAGGSFSATFEIRIT